MAFPVTAATNGGAELAAVTTHPILMPAGVVNGDRVVVVVQMNGTLAPTGWPSGWVSLVSRRTPADGYYDVAYKECDGTEPASFNLTTTAGQQGVYITERIQAGTFDPAVAPSVINDLGTSLSMDAPALTAPWGATPDTGWRVYIGWETGLINYTGSSIASYTHVRSETVGSGGGGQVTAWSRNLNAASENPGALAITTGSNARWCAATVAIKGAAGGGAVSGTLATALAPVTLVAAGSVAAVVTGTLAKVLDPVTLAAAGSAPVTGTRSGGALAPVTLVAAGGTGGIPPPASGTFAQPLAPVTLVAAGSTSTAGGVRAGDMSGGLTAGMQRGLY